MSPTHTNLKLDSLYGGRSKSSQAYLIIYEKDKAYKKLLLSHLKTHLKEAGLKVDIQEAGETNKVKNLIGKNQTLLLFLEKGDQERVSKEFSNVDFIDVSDQQNYYFLVFEILIKLLPDINLRNLFQNFTEQYEGVESSFESDYPLTQSKKDNEGNKRETLHKEILKSKKWYFISFIFCLGLFCVVLQIFKGNREMQIPEAPKELKESFIRSDLPLPTNAVLLQRPEEIAEIEKVFKGEDSIQAVALVGPGGAGKTILSRQYAHQQNAKVIWEINAETRGSLNSSFEDLAQVLAKTEKDQKILLGLQDIKNPTEREKNSSHL